MRLCSEMSVMHNRNHGAALCTQDRQLYGVSGYEPVACTKTACMWLIGAGMHCASSEAEYEVVGSNIKH